MFCSKCGRQNPAGQKFCQYCGAPLPPDRGYAGRGEYPPGQPQRAGKPAAAFRMKPVHWLLIGEVLLAAAGIFVGIRLLQDRYSARHTVERYAEALQAQDWATAYDCLDMQGETGLSREDYIAAQTAKTPELIQQVTVTEVQDSRAEEYWKELSRELGIPVEEEKEENSVRMEISGLVNGDMQTWTVTAVPTEKKWFFFDEWKIVPYNMYGEEVPISFPENASVTINGAALDASALENSGSYGEDSWYEGYVLPHVFYGGYQVRISQEGMEPWTKLVEYGGDAGAFDFTDVFLMPTQETADALMKQYGQISQEYFSAALNGGEFRDLESYFTRDALEEGDAEREFQEIRESAYDSREQRGCLSMEVSDIRGEAVPVTEYYDAVPGDVVLNITGTVTTIQENGSGTPRETSEETSWQVCFHQEDGVWKLRGI